MVLDWGVSRGGASKESWPGRCLAEGLVGDVLAWGVGLEGVWPRGLVVDVLAEGAGKRGSMIEGNWR